MLWARFAAESARQNTSELAAAIPCTALNRSLKAAHGRQGLHPKQGSGQPAHCLVIASAQSPQQRFMALDPSPEHGVIQIAS